jgi:hypothetical protein
MTEQADYDAIATYPTEREAREAVEALTMRGIGATWQPSEGEATSDRPPSFDLLVVQGDGVRACQVLGLPEPDEPDAEEGRAAIPDWVWVAAIFLAALIILPALAFFVTYRLSGG